MTPTNNNESKNPNALEKITSLQNIPITDEGLLSFNFEGDLKDETMLSFLLKTKGKKWVERNTTTSPEDGHLIINGHFSFHTPKRNEDDQPQLKFFSFPQDILSVDFRGEVEPSEMRVSLATLKKVMRSKSSNKLNIACDDLNLDLSDFAAEDLHLDAYSNTEIILPENLMHLEIERSHEFDLSRIKNTDCVRKIQLRNTQSTKTNDLSFMDSKEIVISSSALPVIMPHNLIRLFLNNAIIRNPIQIADIRMLRIEKSTIADGSTINLSKCKEVLISGSTFPKDMVFDFSSCQRLELSRVDLSSNQVILPTKGTVIIDQGVKFPADLILDLSNCESGYVDYYVECKEVKLPKEITGNEFKIPRKCQEITTGCIENSALDFEIPATLRIIDTLNKDEEVVSLEYLKKRGLAQHQLSTLNQQRKQKQLHNFVSKIIPKEFVQKVTETAAKVTDKATQAVQKMQAQRQKEPTFKQPSLSNVPPTAVQPSLGETNSTTPPAAPVPAASAPTPTAPEAAKQKQETPRNPKDDFINALRNGKNTRSGEGYEANASNEENANT